MYVYRKLENRLAVKCAGMVEEKLQEGLVKRKGRLIFFWTKCGKSSTVLES